MLRARAYPRVHRTRGITQGRHSNTRQQGSRMTSWSVPRPHYELLCCAGDYGGAATSIEDIGSPGVSPLPAYYSAAEQSPITSSGTVQKGRPRKRKLSEVTGSELPVTMRLAAGALGKTFIPSIFIFSSLLFFIYQDGIGRGILFEKIVENRSIGAFGRRKGEGRQGNKGRRRKTPAPGALCSSRRTVEKQ